MWLLYGGVDMPWKKVSAQRGSSTEPMISLRKSGSVGLNKAVIEEMFDEVPEHVSVMFDEENNKLGFKAAEEDEEDIYAVSVNNGSGTVNPTSVLENNDLIPDQTTQYTPTVEKVNDSTKIVGIDLDDPLRTYGSQDDDDSTDEEVESEEADSDSE